MLRCWDNPVFLCHLQFYGDAYVDGDDDTGLVYVWLILFQLDALRLQNLQRGHVYFSTDCAFPVLFM
jgi:hypothetical protein